MSGWDHPRVRGEHVTTEVMTTLPAGPSPRARGAPLSEQSVTYGAGTIPACAGSTSTPPCTPSPGGDHPRVRGEHEMPECEQVRDAGPSPRARGARGHRQRRGAGAGTIPACAGSTGSGTRSPSSRGDHPRVRGEHSAWVNEEDVWQGPSPRARGAPGDGFFDPRHLGTIPACAGSTGGRGSAGLPYRDHPRVRGEHHVEHLRMWATLGPSPRARGARHRRPGQQDRQGTIPACAGSTSVGVFSRTIIRDHPRVRGEHASGRYGAIGGTGPSPRARGARRA